MKRAGIGTAVLFFALMAGCAKSPPTSQTEVVALQGAITLEPADPIWGKAPVHHAPLILQDMVEPRLMQPSTPEVKVQAVHDGARVAFRLEWADATEDDKPGMGRFVDACAVQLPAKTSPDVPAPQMGEEGKGVRITYWSAAWQAIVDGRADTIQQLYPGAAVDHYPFEAHSLEQGSEQKREMEGLYSPARTIGNNRAGPRASPVEDLLAAGPGTLAPSGRSGSEGKGTRIGDGWAVVLVRPLPEELSLGARTQAAFAVWEGAQGEVGAKKMRSVWIPLLVEAKK